MGRKLNRILVMTLALAVFMMPVSAFAERDMVRFEIGEIKLDAMGQKLDVGLKLSLTAGATEQMDRALLLLKLLVEPTSSTALEVLAAIEDGAVSLFAQNDYGALPFVIKVPIEDATSMVGVEDITPESIASILPMLIEGMTTEMDEGTAPVFIQAMTAYIALIEAMSDPEYAQEASEKIMTALLDYPELTQAGTETLDMFGESVELDKISAQLNLSGLLDYMDHIMSAIPETKAYWDSYMGALGGQMLTDEDMAEADAAVTFDISYWGSEECLRMEWIIAPTEEEGDINFSVDILKKGEDYKTKVAIAFNIPDESVILNFDMYADMTVLDGTTTENVTMTAAFSEGAGSDFNMDMNIRAVNAEPAAGADGKNEFALTASVNADGTAFGVSINYNGTSALTTADGQAEPTATYTGAFSADVAVDGAPMGSLSCSTLLELGYMPEGVLFDATGMEVVNALEMTEEQGGALSEAFESFAGNIMIILMQSPDIANLLGGLMSGAAVTGT
jgi:hypothetical protein